MPREQGSAVLSDDGRFRYRLDRSWGGGGHALFVMLNPSTADAMSDDPTIRRCVGFAKRFACGGLTVVNLYTRRETNPRALDRDPFEVRLQNDATIEQAAAECGLRFAAWGAWPGPDECRPLQVLELLDATRWEGRRRRLYALGLTKAGAPRHPLYVPGDVEPVIYAGRSVLRAA